MLFSQDVLNGRKVRRQPLSAKPACFQHRGVLYLLFKKHKKSGNLVNNKPIFVLLLKCNLKKERCFLFWQL
jgi:hypothetical protein